MRETALKAGLRHSWICSVATRIWLLRVLLLFLAEVIYEFLYYGMTSHAGISQTRQERGGLARQASRSAFGKLPIERYNEFAVNNNALINQITERNGNLQRSTGICGLRLAVMNRMIRHTP